MFMLLCEFHVLRPLEKSVQCLQNFERKKLPEISNFLNDDPYIFFSHNLFIKSVLAISTLYSLIFCFFKVVYGIMFGVTPDIKIISFGVKRLKNRRVTPNGEENKDEKRNFLHQHLHLGRKGGPARYL
jgi:hypothetical protein